MCPWFKNIHIVLLMGITLIGLTGCSSSKSFNAVVKIDRSDISSVEIVKPLTNEAFTLNDENEIDQLLNVFSKMYLEQVEINVFDLYFDESHLFSIR